MVDEDFVEDFEEESSFFFGARERLHLYRILRKWKKTRSKHNEAQKRTDQSCKANKLLEDRMSATGGRGTEERLTWINPSTASSINRSTTAWEITLGNAQRDRRRACTHALPLYGEASRHCSVFAAACEEFTDAKQQPGECFRIQSLDLPELYEIPSGTEINPS